MEREGKGGGKRGEERRNRTGEIEWESVLSNFRNHEEKKEEDKDKEKKIRETRIERECAETFLGRTTQKGIKENKKTANKFPVHFCV